MNHGIEKHEELIAYAQERVDAFRETSDGFDEFEFCEPQFVFGNALKLAPDTALYDRYSHIMQN